MEWDTEATGPESEQDGADEQYENDDYLDSYAGYVDSMVVGPAANLPTFVARLFEPDAAGAHTLLHAASGLAQEAGEVLGMIHKHIFFRRVLDKDALALELGDVVFYVTRLASLLGLRLVDVVEGNIIKLFERHPHGFSEDYYK